DSKIEFFTNMTHEIKTPLSLIMGPLEYIAQSSVVKDKYGNYLGIIEQNCKRLYALVTQLLDFRKIDSGGFKINNAFINFSSLLNEIVLQFKGEAAKNNVEVKTNIKPENLYLLTDEAALVKVISNLLSNALKFASRIVKVKGVEEEDHYLISVEDDGEGIPQTERAKILEAFYQSKHKDKNVQDVVVGLNMT